MKRKTVFRKLPDYGKLYTIEKFKELCETGCFIDDDGTGYFAFFDKVSNLQAYPSNIRDGRINKNFTHIMWFNK